MATTSLLRRPNGLFWTFVGIGLLALLLAASWRVANGANIEGKWNEVSFKINEASESLEAAQKQLEAQAGQLKAAVAERDAFWEKQLADARKTCPVPPEATPAPSAPPPIRLGSDAATQKALADAARKTAESRALARDLNEMSRPRIFRNF